MEALFVSSRVDGKSNQQVILDMVGNSPPGTLFTYEQISQELEIGTNTVFERMSVQQCVRLANRRLRHEKKRMLRNVKNVGYTLAHARDHRELSSSCDRKAFRQMRTSMDILENVRQDEMTEQERLAHNAQLAVNAEVYSNLRRHTRRQDYHASIIAQLTTRLDQLEERVTQTV